MDAPKGNVKNPAIRRIHADIRELQKDPSDQYHAEPLEENLFEWHFTLRGPPGTDFEGGNYHGRILLPSEYPFKPPNIMLLTPNGRFEVGKKICLSISAHHPEHWQPAWGVRLILEALISFFPTDPKGAVGSLDWTPAERQRLARESQTWTCSRCGLAASLLPELKTEGGEGEGEAKSGDAQGGPVGMNGGGHKTSGAGRYAEEIKQLYVRGASGSVEDRATAGASDSGAAASSGEDSSPPAGGRGTENGTHVGPADQPVPPSTIANQSSSVPSHRNQSTAPPPPSTDPPVLQQRRVAPSHPTAPLPPQSTAATPMPTQAAAPHQQQVVEHDPPAADDKLLYVAVALLVLIVALVARKVMRAYGMDF